MQLSMPNLPETLTYSIVAAFALICDHGMVAEVFAGTVSAAASAAAARLKDEPIPSAVAHNIRA